MSSSLSETECPKCHQTAFLEQDNKTLKIYIWCKNCGYDSQNEEDENE